MKVEMTYRGEPFSLEVQPNGGSWLVTLPSGEEKCLTAVRTGETALQLTDSSANRSFQAWSAETERGVEISLGGRTYVFEKPRPQARRGGKVGASGDLSAPMVGVVTSILVSEGDSVAAHQAVATVEAMKVVATLEAPFDGTVTKVLAKQGDKVGHGQSIILIEAKNEPTLPTP